MQRRIFWTTYLAMAIAFAAVACAAEHGVVFAFREPRLRSYRVDLPSAARTLTAKSGSGGDEWLRAWPQDGSTNWVEFSNRLVVQLQKHGTLPALLAGRPLRQARRVNETTFILETADVLTGLREAESMGDRQEVLACYPVARRQLKLHGAYARRPDDPYFSRPDTALADRQWHLENRDVNGAPAGADLNIRAAWPISRGDGVIVAIGDDGFEMSHPDLMDRTTGAPHLNFHTLSTNAGPSGSFSDHATAVAGLVAATGDNHIGITGVAPRSRLANWVLFDRFSFLPDEERLMDAFQYASNVVSVQNHSWGNADSSPLRPSSIEEIGIANAVELGRDGRGVVIVRSAGNGRATSGNVNDDGYASDPRVIAVAAARSDGSAARYSNPGACVLVAAPSGDDDNEDNPCVGNAATLFTTDRTGSQGYNRSFFTDDLADYAFDGSGFSGTSGSAPQISGVAALILSANPELGYRDVQQILVHSSRHFQFDQRSVQTNGAGFRVSHDLGYGVPDAGLAVWLARRWANRPALTMVTYSNAYAVPIPDLGLRLVVEGKSVPLELASIPALAGAGVHPDANTGWFGLRDVGLAQDEIGENLSGRAALISRGGNYFCDKLFRAARAGAGLGVVFNNRDGTERIVMGGTDLVPIPAVMVSQQDGEALLGLSTEDASVRVRIDFEPARYEFNVLEPLLCEHIAVQIDTDHTRRRDVRITLVSPMGTRSILQHVNSDNLPGPVGWTYYSTQHFYESSVGLWTVEISDEDDAGLGNVRSVNLTVRGVPITDTDADGLDDAWERRHFGDLRRGPREDSDGDGFNQAREQIMGTNPNALDQTFAAELSIYDTRLLRLSWPATANTAYRVRLGTETTTPLSTVTNIPGRFPEAEWFVPYTGAGTEFFQIEALPGPR